MSKRQRSRGGLASRQVQQAFHGGGGLLGSLLGFGPASRPGPAVKAPNVSVQQAAEERRQRRLERNRVNRALGAFTASERPPRPANRGVANPGGERRRNRERQAQERKDAASALRRELAARKS